MVKAAACNPDGKGTLHFWLHVDSDLPLSEDLITAISQDQIWSGLLEKLPFCLCDEDLPFMEALKERLGQNIKETKIFLEARFGTKKALLRK